MNLATVGRAGRVGSDAGNELPKLPAPEPLSFFRALLCIHEPSSYIGRLRALRRTRLLACQIAPNKLSAIEDMTSSDHWNHLAQQIGAEATPETPAPVSPPPAAPPRPVARKPEAPRPTKKAADWNQLASSLGLEVPAEPEPETVAKPPVPPAEPAPPAVDEVPPIPQAELLRQVEPIGDLDWLMRKATPLEEVQPLDQGDVVERDAADEYVEAELVDVEVVEERGEDDSDDEAADESEGRREGDRPRRRRRRRGGRRSRRNREERTAREQPEVEGVAENADLESETVSDAIEASLDAAAQTEFGEEEEAAAEGSAEPRERKGRRRRRRRGRRRSEGVKGEAAETGELSDEAAASPVEDDDDGMLDTADVPLGIEDEEHDEHLDKNSHRAIPSWEDAIGMIVAVNMEARAKSPRSSGPPRGRGRGRGGRSNHRGNGNR